ncbi:MAG: hypothetical protein JST39_01345 [Bacteroidetes bacterium]|nr:hypothetical protein [Bacteroidota bacterium]
MKTTRLSGNSFRVIAAGPEYADSSIKTFSVTGDTVTLESDHREQPPRFHRTKDIFIYRNGELWRKTAIRDGKTDRIYIITWSADRKTKQVEQRDSTQLQFRTVYLCNQQADPEQWFEINAQNDTISRAWINYQYDEKGNWIQQHWKVISKKDLPVAVPASGHNLFVRKITYRHP